jgi:hypothetical protein
MRRLLLVLLILSIAAPGSAWGGTAEAPDPMEHVEVLAADIGPRPAGSSADRRAVRYVAAELGSYGYEVALQRFRLPQGGRSRNVIARHPGVEPDTSLIVGAHLDTVQGSPGANDNASGIAALLDLAYRLRQRTDLSLTLVAFGAEEFQPGTGVHHIGSDAYVRDMDEDDREGLDAMVSADMIGKARRFIVARLAGSKRGASRLLADAVRDAGMRPRVRVLGDISDHGPFARARMPAAFLWTGDEPNHHAPTDRVRNVAPRALRRAVRVLLALVELAA